MIPIQFSVFARRGPRESSQGLAKHVTCQTLWREKWCLWQTLRAERFVEYVRVQSCARLSMCIRGLLTQTVKQYRACAV